MMMHLAEAIVNNGPPWSWSMFPDEWTWHQLSGHLKNARHKEASVHANLKVYHTAVAGVQKIKAPVPDAVLPLTLDTAGEDGSLRLPKYMAYRKDVHVQLSEAWKQKCSVHSMPKPVKGYLWRVALHRFFVANPHLVKSCDHCTPLHVCEEGCMSYADLWQQFLDDEGIAVLHDHAPT
jgi:hypothetical protein